MATKKSDERRRFGVSKAPIPATRVYVKDLPHFQAQGIDGKSWILLDEVHQTRVSVNTYNGNAGKGFKPQSHPIPAEKELARLVKDYTVVKVSDCPVAVTAKAVKKGKKTAKAHA